MDGKTVDGEALLRLVETDALGDFPRTKSNSPGTAQFASLSSADSRVLLKLKDLHQVDFDSDATSHVSQSYTKARMAVLASSALGQSLPVNIGKVTFGTPIPRKPREIGLSVPAFESRNYDVYWIEIATTFRELNLNDIEKLKLEVVFPENAIALELLPKNITVESTDTIVTSNPTVEMEVGKVKVSIGEFYKHTVEYKNLKPTVISYGLREREFGWELSESAKQLGSHMFVAIVGVPKNAKQIPVTLSMLFKVKPKNWLLEGSVASTNPVSLNIRF